MINLNGKFEQLFDVETIKSYHNGFPRVVEQGRFMVKHDGEILNYKSE